MKSLMTLLSIIFIAIVGTLPAHADRVSILLGSHHFGGGDFEEFNPGIFYTWEQKNYGLSTGVFRNSYGRASVAAVGALPLARWKTGEMTVFAGLAYYRVEGRDFDSQIAGDVIGIGGLQVRQGPVFAQVIPMNNRGANALIAFGITLKVKRLKIR